MPGKTIGYARTTLSGHDVFLQVEALKAAGCTEIFTDVGASGNTLDRPGLQRALSVLESGDTLKVMNLDCIARSAAAFSEFRASLGERRIRIALLDGDMEITPAIAEAALKSASLLRAFSDLQSQ